MWSVEPLALGGEPIGSINFRLRMVGALLSSLLLKVDAAVISEVYIKTKYYWLFFEALELKQSP